MKTQSLLTLLGFAATFGLSLNAQSISNARAALFAADFETAQAELASQPATAEVQLLSSLIDIGTWIEQDLPTFAASVGVDSTAVGDYTDLSNYFDSDSLGMNPQPIYGYSEPLFNSENAGVVTYQFPGDEKSILVLHNTSDQNQIVEFSVIFGDMYSSPITFYANNEWMGSADVYGFQTWYNYESWYDDSLEKSFSLTLEAGDYIRFEKQQSYSFNVSTTELSFLSQPEVEVQNGEFWRYDWVRDPANDIFDFELIESLGESWNEDGTLYYWDMESDSEATLDLDYWLSASDLYEWSPVGHLISFAFSADEARQVDLTFFKETMQYGGFEGTLFLNGIEIGDFSSNGFSFEASDVEEWHGYDPYSTNSSNFLYTLSLWLEPADQLTLQVEAGWYGMGDGTTPLFGFNLDVPADFDVSNAIGYMDVYPKLAAGTTSDLFSQFLLSQSAPTSQLLTSLISRLSILQDDGFSVTFEPEETGLTERVRVEYEDTQVLLAFLKFIKGIQLVTDMYSAGAVDATYATYLDYLGDPVALWDDYPQLLTLVQTRSAQGAQAKLLFEQAVAHYTAVESVLWSRISGATESFLFEVDGATQVERSDFSNSLSQFVESLNGSVALADLDPALSAEQSLSLQPLVAASPVNLRQVMPQFNEQGIFAASSGDFLAAGFSSGVSNFEWDQFLADANALYIPAPQSLVGKVLLKKSEWAYPAEYEAYAFSSESALTFADSEESGVHAYTWDSSAAVINDQTWSERTELEFETGVTGTYLWSSDQEWWGEPGSFILYDGTWDLDGDGQEDAEQIAAGEMLDFFLDPFETFVADWDGDGLEDSEEAQYAANPQLADTDGDGLDDWEEVQLYGTDPSDATSKVYSAPTTLPTGIVNFEMLESDYYHGNSVPLLKIEQAEFLADGRAFFGFADRAVWKNAWSYQLAEDGLSGVVEVLGAYNRYDVELFFTNEARTEGSLLMTDYYFDGENHYLETDDLVEITGSFEFVGGSLSIDPQWRYVDDFSGSDLDSDLWKSEYVYESSFVADGRLDFSAALSEAAEFSYGYAEQELSSSRLLPLDEDWVILTEVFNENSAGDLWSSIGFDLFTYDETLPGAYLSASVSEDGVRTSAYFDIDAGNLWSPPVALTAESVHLRVAYDATARTLSLDYELDGEVNGWEWGTLLLLDIANETAQVWDGAELTDAELNLTAILDSLAPEEYFALDLYASFESYSESAALQPLGFEQLSVLESIETSGAVSLFLGTNGYFIGDAEHPLIYQGTQVLSLPGWIPVGVESSPNGYTLIWQSDALFTAWELETSGHYRNFSSLTTRQVRSYEEVFGQDLNGDGTIGIPEPEVFEEFGSLTLLRALDGSGYYLDDSSRPLTWQGDHLGDLPGWDYLGAEVGRDAAYDVFVKNDATGEFVRWGVDETGAIQTGEFLTADQVAGYEVAFDQDLNGDGYPGIKPLELEALEDAGSISLLYDSDGYFYVEDQSRPLFWAGAQLGELPGWTYLGVEAGRDAAYDVFVKNDATGEYVRWGVDETGAIQTGEFLTADQVAGYEVAFDQDLNGDGYPGIQPLELTALEDAGSISLLYDSDGDGYYIDSESRPLFWAGAQLGELPGWTYLGVEAGRAAAYDVFVKNDATGEFVRWGVDETGAIQTGEFLTADQVAGYEVAFDQDLNGDGYPGIKPLELTALEDAGSISLLYDSDGDGYYIDSESRPLSWQGDHLGALPGWTYLGAEYAQGQDTTYDVFVKNDATGEFVRWGVDDTGAIQTGEFLTADQVAGYEVAFDQDLNGDGYPGIKPLELEALEDAGSISLLYDEDGYFYVEDQSRPLFWAGAQLGELPGWTYLGAEAGGEAAYNVFVKNDSTGEFVRWGVNSSGVIETGEFLSAAQVQAYEETFEQDLNGDSIYGSLRSESFFPLIGYDLNGVPNDVERTYSVVGSYPLSQQVDYLDVSVNVSFTPTTIQEKVDWETLSRNLSYSAAVDASGYSQGIYINLVGTTYVAMNQLFDFQGGSAYLLEENYDVIFPLNASGGGETYYMEFGMNVDGNISPSLLWQLDREDLSSLPIGYNLNASAGVTLSGQLNVNIPAYPNESFSDSMYDYAYINDPWVIREKLDSVQIAGVVYEDVVVANRNAATPSVGISSIEYLETEQTIWLARGVGLIRGEGIISIMNEPVVIELQSTNLE